MALIIGNSAYRHISKLENPVNDARLMADTLRKLDFTLIGNGANLNLDEAGLRRVVRSFGAELQGADVALFYFAGHGVQVRGNNYLVPVEANPVREADVDFQMLDVNLVLRQMETAGASLNLVLLDACRNNPLVGRGLRSAASGLAQMQAPQGTLISFATQPGNVALDGTDGNSPYTKALAQAIRKPGLDIFRTFNEVGLAVASQTAGAQQPWVSLSPIKGDFFFGGRPAAEAAPPAQSGEVQRLQERLKLLEDELRKKDEVRKEPSIALVAPPVAPSVPQAKAAKPAVGVFPAAPIKLTPLAPERERALRPKETFRECDGCPEMVVLPTGNFMMGAQSNERESLIAEGPRHPVRIAQRLAVGKFEVTFNEWEACVAGGGCSAHRPDDLGWGRGKRPVVNVSWDDAQAYVAWLSKTTGGRYRLLSEAEWEYAARAGSTTPFSTGEGISTSQANFDGRAPYNGSSTNVYLERTVEAGTFPANSFGLHDMHGNAWEWVEDCWNENYRGAPSNGTAWTTGDCSRRVLRGGSWTNYPANVRSAYRTRNYPDDRHPANGFRVARILNP